MKYRMLSTEELEILAEDFKQFLIVNGVHNEEWVEMNISNKNKAIELVELFSDTVLQKVYEKLRFIEHRSEKSCLVFKLGKEEMNLIALNTSDDKVDLSTPESIHQAILNFPNRISYFKSTKKYAENREEEIHKMLEEGCVNSSEEFWLSLEKIIH